MKGKIVKIEILDAGTINARIIFDIELEKHIDERETRWYDLEYIGESEKAILLSALLFFKPKTKMKMTMAAHHELLYLSKSPMLFPSIRHRVWSTPL